ncbi:zinc finger domain-containing protein [Streptomyces sp. NPDC002530]
MPELAEPAAVVEQFDCPTCEVPAGSTCRTRGGKGHWSTKPITAGTCSGWVGTLT